MPKIFTVAQMQAVEAAADKAGHSYATMMQLAGSAVAERVMDRLVEQDAARVLVLVGPGNNGGDGLVAARVLKEHAEIEVSAYLLARRDDDLYQAAADAGVFLANAQDDNQHRVLKNLLMDADILVDALFGTGTRLPIKGDAAKLLKAVQAALADRDRRFPHARSYSPQHPASPLHDSLPDFSLAQLEAELAESFQARPYVIAVDCPSGLDCDTGAVDDLSLPADETLTFAGAKLGLLRFPGASITGNLYVADIGLPDDLKAVDEVTLQLADALSVGKLLPPRPRHSHKGTFGSAYVVAGSINYVGAAMLCASAAYRSGAGLVRVAVPQPLLPMLAAALPEATWSPLPHNLGVVNKGAAEQVREEASAEGKYAALLVGPGIGKEEESREFMEILLAPAEDSPKPKAKPAIGFMYQQAQAEAAQQAAQGNLPPLIIDADGLNILAEIDEWWTLLPENSIITPHPGEFARLAGLDSTEIEDRISAAQEKAAAWKVILVLKGAFTVVAAPDGRTTLSPFASAALASAGTGDVLAGLITGLLAQGLAPYDAAVAGVWLHGWAGNHLPPRGTLATDVLAVLPEALAVAAAAASA